MQSSKCVRQAMGLCIVILVSCQAAQHCESKFRNYNTLFKMQEKWWQIGLKWQHFEYVLDLFIGVIEKKSLIGCVHT